jgi:hypothetical protein
MSYQLGHMEANAKVKKAFDEVQEYYDTQDKWEWVEWAGKMLMPQLHVQIAMENADMERVEQDMMDKLRLQEEQAQQRRQNWTRRKLSTLGK